MGILVFLPDFEGTDVAAELTARGLGDLLDSSMAPLPTPCRKGPNGRPGLLVTFHPGHTPREYDADSQTWMQAPPDGDLKRGRYWLGYVTAAKPRPEEFQRPTLIDGEPVELCDGRVWVIPCSEFAPKRLTRDPATGAEIKVPEDRYRVWVDWTNALYGVFVSREFHLLVENTGQITIPNGLAYAALTLSQNYRVNTDVVDLLQLLNEHKAFDVARVATGMSILERAAMQKKNLESACPAT
jgi:hypothetical protein